MLPILAVLIPLASGDAAKEKRPPVAVDEKVVLAELEKALKKHDVPALGAAIVSSRGVETLAVAGVRKRGSDVKVTKDDRFHIGSDTKAMTATLIALLVHDKLLSYDTTMEKAFPELAGTMNDAYKKVTLEQLLTHRAGLPANLEIKSWSGVVKDPVRRQRQETAAKALAEKPEVEPGKKFLYSNVGYVLAAAMAERAGKASWEELMERRVFRPLKMTSVGYGPMATPGKTDQPWSHGEKGKPIDPGSPPPVSDNPPVMGPAGLVHCSLADWAKFLADQLKGARGKDGLLPAAAYRKLHTAAHKGEDYSPGGWKLLLNKEEVLGLAHDGSNGYNYATAVLFPGLDLAVVVDCNQGGDRGKEATVQVREALLERIVQQIIKAKK